ncbi:MAG TPA: hypothetical protein VKY74_08800 [Chloroflexia bacterium]|nr:hypothetical protein [Chloroflexia bacterium]
MKTNEWLSYFVEQHQAELVERLEGEIKGRGFTPPAGTGAALAAALEADFAQEAFTATPTVLAALATGLRAQDAGRAPDALAKIWLKVEHLLGGYIAEEGELSGGARRLAYLRLSEFGLRARGVLAG